MSLELTNEGAASTPATPGYPALAVIPATTLHIAKIEPTEISICPVRMISVIPSAMIMTGMFARKISVRFSRLKYLGSVNSRTVISNTIVAPTETSLRCAFMTLCQEDVPMPAT
jgi:hypothetical protein